MNAPCTTTLQSRQKLGNCKVRDVLDVCEFESIKQQVLADKAVPDEFWRSIDVITELKSSGIFTETEEAPHIKDAAGASTGSYRVRQKQKA